MSTGKVKWFNFKKGYGFITPEGADKDVFVHISAVQQSGLRGLREEQIVDFDVNTDDQGRTSASNIKIKE